MKVYTFSEARQNFASVLDLAQKESAVCISRRDGQSFTIQPSKASDSPLDVKGVDPGLSSQEIVDFVREGRERHQCPGLTSAGAIAHFVGWTAKNAASQQRGPLTLR